MYQIYWRSEITHKVGYGQMVTSEALAKAWVAQLNETYKGELFHWYEEVK